MALAFARRSGTRERFAIAAVAEHLLLKVSDRLISLSERGQVVSEPILEQYLHRIEYAADGFVARLYPFLVTPGGQIYEPRHIMIDPSVAFGKACLKLSFGYPGSVLDSRSRATRLSQS